MALTNFPNGLSSFGIPVLGGSGIPFTGTYYFVDALNGSDGNQGLSPSNALASVYKAHSLMTAGNNDVCFVIGRMTAASTTAGTQRLSLANAQLVDSSATAGTLNWTKNGCHLIGITAPANSFQRARFAPPTGVYTQATFGSGNFVVVTGSGCMFANFSVFCGFSTGGASQICWTDNGSRNYYYNVDLAGQADAYAGTHTDSRTLYIGLTGSGENTFENCTFGTDTVDKTAANAILELAGGTPRNQFKNCTFPMRATSATVLSILVTGASAIDRWQRFDNCLFLNAMSSGGTAQTAIVSMTDAAPNGYLAMNNCGFVGDANTNWGDTNALANMYVLGATPLTASNGIMIKPS